MRNKKAFSFLLPVLLSAILTAFVIIDTFPRLLDTVNFFQNNLKTIDVSSDEISVKNHRYLINGQTYITGFKNEIVEEGANYTIYYLPNTKVIIRREKVEILPGSGPIIEEIPISD